MNRVAVRPDIKKMTDISGIFTYLSIKASLTIKAEEPSYSIVDFVEPVAVNKEVSKDHLRRVKRTKDFSP